MNEFRFDEVLRKCSDNRLAKQLNVRRETITGWHNHRCNPSAKNIVKIVKETKESSDYLLGIDDQIRVNITNFPIKLREPIKEFINNISNIYKEKENK